MAYVRFGSSLSTGVIAAVDDYGKEIDMPFAESTDGAAWFAMTSPNPQFPDQVSPFKPLGHESISESAVGVCMPDYGFPCLDTTDPVNNTHLVFRGNKKVIAYAPVKDTCHDGYGLVKRDVPGTDLMGSGCDVYRTKNCCSKDKKCAAYETDEFKLDKACLHCGGGVLTRDESNLIEKEFGCKYLSSEE